MRTATKIQLAATLFRVISTVRGLFGANDFVQVVRKGLRWDLDLSEGIDLAIFAFGQFENGTAKALAGLIGPGAIVLDIGANVGAHTLPWRTWLDRRERFMLLSPRSTRSAS